MKPKYLLFSFFAKLLAYAPFWFLHGFSDFLYLIVYKTLGYRKKVVRENLKNSFPEKTDGELYTIEKKYYHHLCDIIVENLKVPGMSEKTLRRRVKTINPEVLRNLYDKGKSVFLVIGHIGNWEWTGSLIGLDYSFQGCAIIKPLNDQWFHHFMHEKIRRHFYPLQLIPFKQTYRTLLGQKDQQLITVIASDQTPTESEINYWTTFLHQETGFFLGIEKMSKGLDYAVVYMDTKKRGRSRYDIQFELITDNAKETDAYEITDKYVECLEDSICNQPENWLWSHRRWKYKRK
ncbi:MAG: lysophospholipid acyltransferase family protein [Bacteroidales bacterium]